MMNSSLGRTGTVGRIDNCLFESNIVREGSGGGLQFFFYGIHEIRNTVIRGNMQSNSVGSAVLGGGGIYNMNGGNNGKPLILYNCAIVSNSAPVSYGGGIHCRSDSDHVIMYNTIVYSNTGYSICLGSAVTSLFAYCCFPTNNIGGAGLYEFGAGNITNPPAFVDFAGKNLRLTVDSPCVNSGTNQSWMIDAVDLDGKKRLRYGRADMGAYELIYDATIYRFH